jgi:hypothetical protein
MNFNYIDINMDSYITNFKNNSLVLKPDSLRGEADTVPMTTIPFMGTTPTPTPTSTST